MSGSTVGRLLPGGDFSIVGLMKGAPSPISGQGPAYLMCSTLPGATQPRNLPFAANHWVDAGFNAGYCGLYKIVGTTAAVGNTPYAALVLLCPETNPTLTIASAFTDSITGAFTFTNLARGNYIVSAIDITGTYNGVDYTFVAAVGM